MRLFTILRDRNSVNALKLLYMNEKSNKISTPLSEIKEKIKSSKRSIKNLVEAKLITSDSHSLSINEKGKEFIKQFDNLKDAFYKEGAKQKAFQVIYDLTQIEQRILALTKEISKELNEAPLKLITKEIPFNLNKHIKSLTNLNLIENFKKDNEEFIKLTESGIKVIENQLSEVL